MLLCLVAAAFAANESKDHRDAGRKFEESGDWPRAEHEFRLCTQAVPDAALCAAGHAEALSHLDQPYDGILELEAFLKKQPDSVAVLKEYAKLLELVARDMPAAERALRRAGELSPNDSEIWHALGEFYDQQNQPEKAIEAWGRAIVLQPGDPLLIAGMAWSYGLRGDQEHALAEFKRAVQIDGRRPVRNSNVFILYGAFLRSQGQSAASIPVLTEAMQSGSTNWRLYYERALARAALTRYSEAEPDALRALKEGGERRDVRLLLLRIYRGLNRPERVSEQLKAVEALTAKEDQQYAAARELRASLKVAEAAIGRNDCAAAIVPYENVVRLMPTFYEAWFPLGVCYSRAGRTADSEHALETYLGFQPLSADGHATLGLLYIQTGKDEEASRELKKALALDPEGLDAVVTLARLDFQRGEKEEALRLADCIFSSGVDGDLSDLYASAARAAGAAGDGRRALDYCKRGLAAYPASAPLEAAHAEALLDCSETLECRKQLLDALRSHPESAAYQKAAVFALVQVNARSDETAASVQALVRRFPDDGAAWLIHSEWQARRNHYHEALEEAEKALKALKPGTAACVQAFTLIGQSQSALGNSQQALAAFRQAWELDRQLGLPDLQAALAWAGYLKASHPDEAARVLDLTLAQAAGFAPAQLMRAQICAENGQEKAALEHALLAVKQSDDPRILKEAHFLLSKTYIAMGQTKEAHLHAEWLRAHP